MEDDGGIVNAQKGGDPMADDGLGDLRILLSIYNNH